MDGMDGTYIRTPVASAVQYIGSILRDVMEIGKEVVGSRE
jgi:hypothetical protein